MQATFAEVESGPEPVVAMPEAENGKAVGGNGDGNDPLIEAMIRSRVYQEYERSFTDATGLPVVLTPVETWQLPHHGRPGENPFCALIAKKSRACVACLQTQEKLCGKAVDGAQTVVCPVGLCDSAVPVRMGSRLVGFLRTGQVFRKKPGEVQFNHAARLSEEWGIAANRSTLRHTYFSTKIVPPKQYESIVKLLTIFSQHLTMLGNQIFMQQKNSELPAITKAREYIHEHSSEELTLADVARSINTSTFYFCKLFKRVTGIHFTEYVSRVRIERSKNLLLNPNLRISEIAFEVGFQSLTHFNRMFKKILGQSPTAYRTQLLEH
ncbi:MAG TPA: helix-turn-helix domain-containing protein [Verrucomicrobiae bacterium]|nr:helix-turn-helix domain-containing protein [Verrucomicrobiae bacterium]